MVHLKRSLLLLAAILAIQFLQPDGLFAANRRAKAKPKPKAKAGLTAKSALVMNMTTGEILFSKNPDEPIAPASLTKILSLYLIYEALGEGKVRTSDIVYVSSNVSHVDGSRMRIRPGSQIALGDLMKGMAVMSANDASVAAAEYVGGDVDEFVRRMNVKALELGMTGSHFSNPSGLREEGQVTTARDILTLSCAYINRFPQSLQMHSLPVFEYGQQNPKQHESPARDESLYRRPEDRSCGGIGVSPRRDGEKEQHARRGGRAGVEQFRRAVPRSPKPARAEGSWQCRHPLRQNAWPGSRGREQDREW